MSTYNPTWVTPVVNSIKPCSNIFYRCYSWNKLFIIGWNYFSKFLVSSWNVNSFRFGENFIWDCPPILNIQFLCLNKWNIFYSRSISIKKPWHEVIEKNGGQSRFLLYGRTDFEHPIFLIISSHELFHRDGPFKKNISLVETQ